MFSNHLKIAIRNLLKRKGYTLLNILGLSIGITCCLLIFQYVAYERGFDQFAKDAGQIVRLRLDNYQKGKLAWQSATVYPAIAPTMKKDFPEVENFCRLIDANLLLSNDEKGIKFHETKGYYADASVLDMLGVEMLRGDPNHALDGPDKIILSSSTARKYFGSQDPVGKRLTVRNGDLQRFEVTGVFRDYPENSHLIMNHIVSYSTLGKQLRLQGDSSNATETAWGWYDFYAYLKLRPGTDWKNLESKLPAFCNRYINNQRWNKTNNVKNALFLIPLKDIHLRSNYNQEAEVNGDGKSVGFLFLIAFFIIGIAWINYTNLATARSTERAREVGVRKVMGALRKDLIIQFMVESILLNLLAVLLAGIALLFITGPFNQLIGSRTASHFSLPASYWAGFITLFLAGTLLSGLYPAFILSGYHPITVLKGIFKHSTKGLLLRKGLIIGQFAASVILIAGTIIVYQQVQYMRNQQLGANIEQTLVLEGAGSLRDSLYNNVFQPFKTDLLRQPSIRSVTASSSVMGQEIYWTNGIERVGVEKKNAVTLYILGVDYDFLPAFGLNLVAGRNFSNKFGTDKHAALINENAVEALGFKNAAEALNARIVRNDTLTIVGVIANFHQEGLQKVIQPMLVILTPEIRDFYSLKITALGDLPKTLGSIESTWNRYFPLDPFHYFFLDDSFNAQYKSDIRFGKVFGMFAFLAILIACFGLLGLSAYNVSQRTKEIGIRKVLGASEKGLLILLSKDFLYLVLFSLILAIPLAWWVMEIWLRDFAYRISIQWWVFLFSGCLALLIALLTVSVQALRAAMSNPAVSLRTE